MYVTKSYLYSAGDEIQGFVHGKLALYQPSYSPLLLAFFAFYL